MKALTATEFNFPGQKSVYHGKVRDVYNINGEKLVMVATDRISAFDVVLPKGIPFKGQMLNQIAAKFLDATTDICPNWKMATPEVLSISRMARAMDETVNIPLLSWCVTRRRSSDTAAS